MFEYQLIRSKRRKTLLLQVKYGQVIVRAPYAVSATFIDDFIQQKSSWLHKKVIAQQKELKFCDFSQDTNLLFLGDKLTLNIETAKQANIFITESSTITLESLNAQTSVGKQCTVVIRASVYEKLTHPIAQAKQVKKQLEKYFKQQAEQLIVERLEHISQKISLKPTKITIRQYRARWGSCNNRGEVSFNYLLMMTPLFVIDYVIVHELCHLEHLDHSKSFWQLVEKHFPHYKSAKEWLNCHQAQLYWQTPK